MNLGIFLALGDSFKDMAKTGQDTRFKELYIKKYAKDFDKVFVFSYENEKVENLPENVFLVPNKNNLHRYLYGLILPFINPEVKGCDAFRVFHLHGTIPAIVNKIFLGKKFVFNYAYDYSKFALIEGKYFQALFYKLLEPLAIKMADKILAANKTILKKVADKGVYLPNGVDISFFKPEKKKDSPKKIILSVGRLEKQKNFENLIKALSGLNVKLVLVGAGSQEEKLIKMTKDLKLDLEIIEKVDNDKMPQVYNNADVFILPSLIEGHPKVLLEAMACGLPCIGSNVEGINEIIKDKENGLLTGTSSEEIRSSIMELLYKPELNQELGKEAREFVSKNFRLNDLLNREVKILKNVA